MKLVGFMTALLLTPGAHAGTLLTCTYLTKSDGSPYPGLSRPQVRYDENRVDVGIEMDAGGGTVSRVSYQLFPTNRVSRITKFADATKQILFVTSPTGGTLNVKGLISRCQM